MAAVMASVGRDFPESGGTARVYVVPRWSSRSSASLGRFSSWCSSATGVLLVLACVNVTNLLLARGAARGREMAVRVALGAGRGRIVRQLLTESLLLAAVGAILGVAGAYAFVRLLLTLGASQLPRLDAVAFDGRVLVFALTALVVCGVLVEVLLRYPGVKALDGVDLVVRQHEVLGLAGENGAGKSTLLKALVGLVRPDAGEIWVRGEKVRIKSVVDAADHGIGMVFQEQSLVPNLTAAENIVLGSEGRGVRRGVYRWDTMRAWRRSSWTRSARTSTRSPAPTPSPSPTGRWSRSPRCCASRSAPRTRR